MSFKFSEGGVDELKKLTGCNKINFPIIEKKYLVFESNEPYTCDYFDWVGSDGFLNLFSIYAPKYKNYLAIRNPNYIDMEKYIFEYKHLIGCEYHVENDNREYFITEQHINVHWKHDKPALWDSKIKFYTEDDELVTYEEYMELYYPEYRHVWERQS
jgi:hypothetical protein